MVLCQHASIRGMSRREMLKCAAAAAAAYAVAGCAGGGPQGPDRQISAGIAAWETRMHFNAPLEPPATVLHGAGQDIDGFREYSEALGATRQPVLYMTYVGVGREPAKVVAWGRRLNDELARLDTDEIVPQVGLNMTGGKGIGRDAEVADGTRDQGIAAFCEALAALGRPAFVRIGYEFEARWNGYRPETYKAAFIRVAGQLRAHAPQTVTVWNAAGCASLEALMEYYPGDEWVDWWSINLFGRKAIREHGPRFCDGARRRGKPVMIGESSPQGIGALQGQTSWEQWYAPYFALIRARPEIKAFCYVNWEWRYWSEKTGHQWHNWGDCRIERDPIVLRHYRQEMDSPLYQHCRAKVRVARGDHT